MLGQRSLTAIIGLPIIVAVTLIGGVPFSIAVGLILGVAMLEFAAAAAPGPQPDRAPAWLAPGPARLLWQQPLTYLGVGLVALLTAAAHNGADWWAGCLVLSLFLTLVFLIVTGQVEDALRQWLWVVGGVAYVGLLGTHLVFLRDFDNGRDWVLLALLGTFITDTSAYFVGKAIGERKLAPRMSPGKTVEGTLGGLIAGAIGVVVLNWLLGLRVSPAEVCGLALLLPIVAVIGDLGESLLKRGAGIKDASGLVPGHGGFLDRLDSILFCVPLVYYYVLWVVE